MKKRGQQGKRKCVLRCLGRNPEFRLSMCRCRCARTDPSNFTRSGAFDISRAHGHQTHEMDPQLVLFRRQYLQLFEPDFLAWPPKQLLRDSDVQAWLYANLFNNEKNSRLPPERYQLRVLKTLVKKIEQSIEDPEEDVGARLCFQPLQISSSKKMQLAILSISTLF